MCDFNDTVGMPRQILKDKQGVVGRVRIADGKQRSASEAKNDGSDTPGRRVALCGQGVYLWWIGVDRQTTGSLTGSFQKVKLQTTKFVALLCACIEFSFGKIR